MGGAQHRFNMSGVTIGLTGRVPADRLLEQQSGQYGQPRGRQGLECGQGGQGEGWRRQAMGQYIGQRGFRRWRSRGLAEAQ